MSTRRDADRAQLDGPSAAAWSAIAEVGAADPTAIVEAGSASESPFDWPEPERYARGLMLGAGGMGRVTQAFDRRLGREVALKELTAPSPEHEARLAREAAITARLDHPGVVVVHDAGRTPDGALFYTMRVVRGRTLDQALAAAGDDLEARLRLLRHVLHACEAVAFAHRHGVVHRDLKPANIMVGEFGETQVLDWGLARVVGDTAELGVDLAAPLDDSDVVAPALTRYGAVVGTPRYMSPEQASGAAPSPLADVWSLGAILFELCAGEPLRKMHEKADSAAILAAARDPAVTDLRQAAPRVSPDLAALVNHALAPVAWRYADAKALAEELAAWLDGRRIGAHTYSAWDLLKRAMRAWRVPIAIGLAALLATVVGLAIAFAETDAERERAVAAEGVAQTNAADLRAALARAEDARQKADHSLARLLSAKAAAFADDDARPEAEVLAARAFELAPSPEARAAVLALARAGRPELRWAVALPARCRDADVTPDLSLLACGDDTEVALYDLVLGQTIGPPRWRAKVRSSWGVTVFEAAGVLVSASPFPLAAFALADSAALTLPALSCCTYPPYANLAGNALAFAGTAQLSVLKDGAVLELAPCSAREEIAGAVDDTGTRWAMSCGDGALFVGDVAGAGGRARFETPLKGPRGPASALAFATASKIVMGTSDGQMLVYDMVAGAVVHDVASGVMMAQQVVTSPDGRWAVVVGDRGAPRLFDMASGTWRGRLPGGDAARRLRFLRQGRDSQDAELVTLGGALRVWRLQHGDATNFAVGGGVTGLVLSPDGATLAVTRGKGVELRDAASGERTAHAELDGIVKPGGFTADGAEFVASAGSTRQVQRWQVDGWEPSAALQAGLPVSRVVALRAADGAVIWVAAPHRDGVLVWRDGAAEPVDIAPLRVGFHGIELAVRADARQAVMLAQSDEVSVLDADVPLLRSAFVYPGALSLALDAAAAHVLLGERGGASLVRLEDGAIIQFFSAPGRALIAVALASDGRYAAGGDAEGGVIVWDAVGDVHAVFEAHTRRVSALRFAPDASWLATGSWDETVRIIKLDATIPTLLSAERAWGLTLDAVLR